MNTKDSILNELLNNKEPVSGQLLANIFGVSRNAIWKQINLLKEEGFDIISDKNGYKISKLPSTINEVIIQHYLKEKIDIYYYPTIGSTNDEAKKILVDHPNDFLVISDNQTKGKGRQGKSFVSLESGIFMSLCLSINDKFENIVTMTTYTSLAVLKAIREVIDIDIKIKWVNDIYYNNKKICGILCEAVSDFESGIINNIIIGIGINIRAGDKIPEELKDIIGTIDCDDSLKNEIVAKTINNIYLYKENKEIFMNEYKEYSLVIGKEIIYYKNNVAYSGKAIDIDDEGGLIIINSNNKKEVLKSGEISVRFKM